MVQILSVDLGGTKTLLSILLKTEHGLETLFKCEYKSADFDSFEILLSRFLSESKITININAACFAIAGPIATDKNSAQVTNLPWKITKKSLSKIIKCEHVFLLNDFEAVAYAIPGLEKNHYITLQEGEYNAKAPALVIGAGTGLGLAQILTSNNNTIVLPSEAGHMDFTPANHQQIELYDYLLKQNHHVSIESVLSGQGLINIYNFLVSRNNHQKIIKNISAENIALSAQQGDDLSSATFKLFIQIYGAITGNCALYSLPFSGLYIAGGIASKNLDHFTSGSFINAMLNKNKMTNILSMIPVHVIKNPESGLLGAAKFAALRC